MNTMLLMLATVFTLASCSAQSAGSERYEERLARIEAELLAEVGDAAADAETQCEVLLYGSKPCGGHWRSLVYSTATGDQDRIKQLAEDYTRVQAEMNRKLGLISDCMLEPVPQPIWVGGVCSAATGSD